MTGGPHAYVVLVRPEHPVNVGAAARAIRNTGLRGLRLVAPGDWRTLECWRSAWGAHDVLEQAQVFDRLELALADAAYAAALSGRRDPRLPALDVRDLAGEFARRSSEQPGCLVFGPETSGLTAEEVLLCGRSARIPSHPDQPSLNLAQAVMVTAYEVFRATRSPAHDAALRATHGEKQALLELWRDGLRAVAALPRGDEHGFERWRALFGRLDLTPAELRLFEHAARKFAAGGREPRRATAPAEIATDLP